VITKKLTTPATVRDAVAAFHSSLKLQLRRPPVAVYVLNPQRGHVGRAVDVAIVFNDDIDVDDRMQVSDLAADASERTGVEVREWTLSASAWSHPKHCVNSRFVARMKRVGVPIERMISD